MLVDERRGEEGWETWSPGRCSLQESGYVVTPVSLRDDPDTVMVFQFNGTNGTYVARTVGKEECESICISRRQGPPFCKQQFDYREFK